MPALVLKGIPRALHKRLQQEARSHRRSMTQEAIRLIEEGLGMAPVEFPPPVKGTRPLTQEFLTQAIHEGRS